MAHFVCISVLLILTIRTADCLSCYSCTDVLDESVCTARTTCGNGHSCYKHTRFVNNTEQTTTMGCLDNVQCSSITVASSLVGRDLNKRQSQPCRECCSTDLCNINMCNHQNPKVCIDDELVDCARMNSIFNICTDVQHAKTICPRFCMLCNIVDGNWSSWSGWSNCDVSCNNGTETRTRSCTNPQPEHGGLDCVGNKQEVRSCGTDAVCPIHGGWASWFNWGPCSVSCGTGIQNRKRTCTNPKPAFYGDHCFGQNLESRLCMEVPCADGGWSSWSSWSNCSRTCGVGIRSQSRACNNPVPSQNGHYCFGDPFRVDICVTNKECNTSSATSIVPKYSDCSEIKLHEVNASDGVYYVTLWKTNRTVQVYCDMTTDGGGWTVFQNRYNGSVDFYRNYTEYVHGFGDLLTEFWLGLDYIQEMTSHTENVLRVDLMSADDTTAFEVLRNFSLSLPDYTLHIGNTISSNNINLAFGYQFGHGSYGHNGHAFTTFDHDMDSWSGNCAVAKHGGWWYNKCYVVNLNGQYLTPGSSGDTGLMYFSFDYYSSLKQTRMAFRRK